MNLVFPEASIIIHPPLETHWWILREINSNLLTGLRGDTETGHHSLVPHVYYLDVSSNTGPPKWNVHCLIQSITSKGPIHTVNQGCFNLGMSFKQGAELCNHSCCLYTHLAVVQDHDPAAAHHCVETVGDDEGCAAAKRRANGLLDETICLSVDGCSCLVQYKNLKQKQEK